MKITNIVTVLLVALILTSCSPSAKVVSTETAMPTSTLTPSPVPTHTPTFTPTPMGGRSGLLLSFNGSTIWEVTNGAGDWRQGVSIIYTYDMASKKNKLLLDGYHCIGVSPDGKKIAMRKTENGKTDLFVMDLAKPEKIVLLYENVVNTNPWSDYSYWFPGSEWIGFIALKDGTPQIFVIHSDGSNLTQVTNSSIGAIRLEPVFRDGIYWSEGTENKHGQGNIQNHKWTKLDGTEMTIQNFLTVSPSGKYIGGSMKPQNPDCRYCDYVLGNPATGEIKEITLVRPMPDNEFPDVQPLSDGKWLVEWRNKNGQPETIEYWIYSSDGKPLFAFADLPHNHAPLPEGADNVDTYNIVKGNSSRLPVLLTSPDGNFLLIRHDAYTQEKVGSNAYGDIYSRSNEDINYYLMNLSTFEIQQVPDLISNETHLLGQVHAYYWIELP
ncbi:MAG: hypothetical protein K8S20_12425 [Chloroflexi bacterium]|nr:hypothetical protein [Chloroflexota bacterium]